MALSDRVIARLSNADLVSLTNAGPPTGAAATTVDATRLAAACSDAAELFEDVVGAAYDDTDASHYRAGVLAVHLVLLEYAGTQAEALALKREQFQDAADKLGLTRGGRARILPQTTSELTPSDETPDGVDVRPDFDRANLSGTFLRAPHSSRRSDVLDQA